MKLSELAEIRSGFVLSRFRRSKDEPAAARYRLLTLSAVDDAGMTIDTDRLEGLETKAPLSAEHLTRTGDIVMRLTAPYTAVLIGEAEQNIAVPSTFIVVRIKDERADPAFIAWLLNRPARRRDIERNTWASVLKAVNVQYFNDLELRLPALEQQRLIARVSSLVRREAQLLQQLADAKNALANTLLERHYKTLPKRG